MGARPSSVVAVGATRCDVVTWRSQGQLRLTVIVKASFDLVPGGPMTPAAPEDIVGIETHDGDAPSRSVRRTSDLAPFLPAADALLVGHAHAPAGAPARALTVRFAVFRERALVEKVIHVYGERTAGGEIAPFQTMPLVYERAFGGPGSGDNPVGTGAGSTDRPPNLVDPQDRQKPACFAPISSTWPSRKRLLDDAQQEGLQAPVVDLAGDFSFAYFHAAPPDQRVAQYLNGNEWVVLDGLHPTLRSLPSRLPDAVGAARVYGLTSPLEASNAWRDVPLVLDTLRVDADLMSCSLTWRGHVVVPDEAALASLDVVGGVALGKQAIEWPVRPIKESAPPPPQAAKPSATRDERASTAVPVDEAAPVAQRKPLPFAGTKATIATTPTPRAAPRRHPLTGTLDGAMNVAEPGKSSTLPFSKPGDAATANVLAARLQRHRASSVPPADPAPMPSRTASEPPRRASPSAPPGPFTIAPQVAPSGLAPGLFKTPPAPLVATPAPAAAPAVAVRKAAHSTLGIDLFPDGRLALTVVPWGLSPARDVLTVIAKATCDLAPAGPAVLRATPDPPTGEAFSSGAGPRPRCVYPSDLVPYKVRADVVLVGHAFAPGGSATSMDVTFRFGSEENAFARQAKVFGDRHWQKGSGGLTPSAPLPFTRMPMAFDHAFGGARFARNVVGIGHHDPMARRPVPLPNLEDPAAMMRSPRQSPPPAAFAPIPLAWKDRWADQRESGLCLAELLDWARFQAAPIEQQLAFLRGDEAYAITGMSARHRSIEGTLPGIGARCFIERSAPGTARPPGAARERSATEPPRALEEIRLRLDTVVFDVDAMKIDLVWRGAAPVADEREPALLGVYLLAEPLGAELPFADACRKVLRP